MARFTCLPTFGLIGFSILLSVGQDVVQAPIHPRRHDCVYADGSTGNHVNQQNGQAAWRKTLGAACTVLFTLAAIAGVVHFWMLVKSDIRLPLTFAFIVLFLLGYRLFAKYAPLSNPTRRKSISARIVFIVTSAMPSFRMAQRHPMSPDAKGVTMSTSEEATSEREFFSKPNGRVCRARTRLELTMSVSEVAS